MHGLDLKKLAAMAAICLAAAHATAQQQPLPLPAEIDASGPGKPKGEGNVRNAAQEARKEDARGTDLKKCDELQDAAAKSRCKAQAVDDRKKAAPPPAVQRSGSKQ